MDNAPIRDKRCWHRDRATQQIYDRSRLAALAPSSPELADSFAEAQVQLSRVILDHYNNVGHHVEPMDFFLQHELPKLLQTQSTTKPVVVPDRNSGLVHVVKWDRPRIGRPARAASPSLGIPGNSRGIPQTPHRARLPNKSYYGFVVVDIWWEVYRPAPGATGTDWYFDHEVPTRMIMIRGPMIDRKLAYPDFHLFDLQLLMGCCLDHVRNGWISGWLHEYKYDEGGYYMGESSTGNERQMPLSENLAHNDTYLFCENVDIQASTSAASAAGISAAAAAGTTSAADADGGNGLSSAAASGESGGKNSASKSFHASMTYQRKSKFDNQGSDALSLSKKTHARAPVKTIEIRACHEDKRFNSTSTLFIDFETFHSCRASRAYGCSVRIQFIEAAPVPLTVLVLGLGWTLEQLRRECRRLCRIWGTHHTMDMILLAVFRQHPVAVQTQKDALLYISELGKKGSWPEDKRLYFANKSLVEDVLPFIGMTQESHGDKARYLTMCLWMLMCHSVDTKMLGNSDHDHYAHQRYETNGWQLGTLLRRMMLFFLRHAENTLRNMLQDNLDIVWDSVFKQKWLTKRLAWCMSTGCWCPTKNTNKSTKRNVTMNLTRLNGTKYLSDMRRVNTGLKHQDKTIRPRQKHISHMFTICKDELNEGELCGVVRYLARVLYVTLGSPAEVLWRILSRRLPYHPYHAEELPGVADAASTAGAMDDSDMVAPPGGPSVQARYALVTVNGKPMAWAHVETQAPLWVATVRRLRREGLIDRTVEVVWKHMDNSMSTIRILCDPQRPVRPLVIVHPWLSWLRDPHLRQRMQDFQTLQEYIEHGLVEMIGSAEAQALSIGFSWADMAQRAMKHGEVFTHCEVDGAFMSGTTGEGTPFSNHNQAIPYDIIQPCRAHGVSTHFLLYGQRPLVSASLNPGRGEHMYGVSPITVVVASQNTQEDNNEMNQTFLDMGGMRSYSNRCYLTTEHRHNQSGGHAVQTVWSQPVERHERPDIDSCIGMKNLRYEELMDNGFPPLGVVRSTGDAMAGKTVTTLRFSKTALIEYDADSRNEYKLVKKRDESVETRQGDCGQVSKIVVVSQDQKQLAKITHTCPSMVVIGDKFCLTPDHDVLTADDGWVPIGALKPAQRVATMDPQSGHVLYLPATELVSFVHRADEALIHIRNARVDLCATLGHRMWTVEYGFLQARELVTMHGGETVHFQALDGERLPVRLVNEEISVELQRAHHTTVHCLTVPPHHLFYVRRHGKACWTGNSSRHGQKNTLGLTFLDEDAMQDEETGETPDFKLDTVCLTSRMTMGQLREMMFGIKAVRTGRIQNGRPFQKRTSVQLQDGTVATADHFLGYRTYIDGRTGVRIQVMLFTGLPFNQKLKHMVKDKIHARAQGQVMLLTGQPVESRSKDGGQRFGEMENSCLIAYGAAENHLEHNYRNSGGSITWVCERCGNMAIANPHEHLYQCNVCETGAFVCPAKANRTFFQEVQALHYWPRFRLGEDTSEGPKVSTIFEPSLARLFKTNKQFAQPFLPALDTQTQRLSSTLQQLVDLCADDRTVMLSSSSSGSSSSSTSSSSTSSASSRPTNSHAVRAAIASATAAKRKKYRKIPKKKQAAAAAAAAAALAAGKG